MVQEESNKNLHKVLIKAVHPFICHLHKFIFILFHVLKTSQIQFKKYRRKIKIQQTHNFYAYLLQVNPLQFLLSFSPFTRTHTHWTHFILFWWNDFILANWSESLMRLHLAVCVFIVLFGLLDFTFLTKISSFLFEYLSR